MRGKTLTLVGFLLLWFQLLPSVLFHLMLFSGFAVLLSHRFSLQVSILSSLTRMLRMHYVSLALVVRLLHRDITLLPIFLSIPHSLNQLRA